MESSQRHHLSWGLWLQAAALVELSPAQHCARSTHAREVPACVTMPEEFGITPEGYSP